MTLKGHAETALGIGLVFSAIGGMFGTIVLTFTAPALADVALHFSSFEYFWLVLMGLSCAVFIASDRPLKGFVTLLIGLLCGSVGLENPAAHPRFTFGNRRPAGRPEPDSGDDRPVRRLGECMRFAQFGDSLMVITKQVGKVLSRAWAGCCASTGARPCAAASWAPSSAHCPAPAPTSRRGCRTR